MEVFITHAGTIGRVRLVCVFVCRQNNWTTMADRIARLGKELRIVNVSDEFKFEFTMKNTSLN